MRLSWWLCSSAGGVEVAGVFRRVRGGWMSCDDGDHTRDVADGSSLGPWCRMVLWHSVDLGQTLVQKSVQKSVRHKEDVERVLQVR